MKDIDKYDRTFAMAKIGSNENELPRSIWITEEILRHDPFIRVSRQSDPKNEKWEDCIIFKILPIVEILNNNDNNLSDKEIHTITSYIKNNRSIILKYWKGEIDVQEYLENELSV